MNNITRNKNAPHYIIST